MSEKRFEWIDNDTISDNQTDEWYCFLFDDRRDDFVDLLNEQQSIIRRDEMSIKTMMSNMEKLEEENKYLKKRIKAFSDMSEKRFVIDEEGISDNKTDKWYCWKEEVVDLLNEQDEEIQRWKNLYEIKDAEVTARVDALNKVCEYYTSEVLFKSDVDPNKAVQEVINRILNTEVKW